MGSKRRNREVRSSESVRAPLRHRLEERPRRYYYDGRGLGGSSGGLNPTALIAVAGIAVAVVLVAFIAVGPKEASPSTPLPGGASAQRIQLVPATTGAVEDGKASVSLEEVRAKGMVHWDFKQADGKTTPLMAYFAPSGVAKVAVRICDGNCNDLSFRIEGNQMVCDACGTKWDLETVRGISGSCQNTPPKVLPSRVLDGKLIVDA